MKNSKISTMDNDNSLLGQARHNAKKGKSNRMSKSDRKQQVQLRKFKRNNS